MNLFRALYPSLAAVLLGCILAVSCSTTKQVESSTWAPEPEGPKYDQPDVAPQLEIRPYLVEEPASLILKATPARWPAIAPLVEEFLGGEAGPAGDLAALFTEISGHRVSLAHLDRSRPVYLVMAPRRHHPQQGCLLAGLPCTLLDSPGPRFGRFLLPSSDPGLLASEISESVGDGDVRILPHTHWVRVEFATAQGQPYEPATIYEHLGVRVLDNPDDAFLRQTPARSALLQSDAPFGAYLDLRGALEAAMYLDQWRLDRRLKQLPASARMEVALRSTMEIARLTNLDMPSAAEVEDLSILVDGDGDDNFSVDVVSTRTPVGRKVANVATTRATLPKLDVSEPSLAADWSLRLGQVGATSGRAGWLGSELSGSGFDVGRIVRHLGGWNLIGAARAPSAVGMTILDNARSANGGLDFSNIVAGRLRMQGGSSRLSSFSELDGGAVLLVSPGPGSDSLVEWFEDVGRSSRLLDTDILRRDDGMIEARLAVGRSVDGLVRQESSQVEEFSLAAEPGLVRSVARLLGFQSVDRYQGAVGRAFRALTSRGAIHVSHEGTRSWAVERIGIGRRVETTPTMSPVDFSSRQPRAVCFDEVARMSANLIDDALDETNPYVFLADRLSTQVGYFRETIADCGGIGVAESEMAHWAKDYFDGWHSLVDYRAGNGRWGPRLAGLCQRGYQWACEVEPGRWPWTRRAQAASGP